MASPKSLSLAVVLLAVFSSPVAAAITSQFQHFYSQHRPEWNYVLHHNCSTQFANYLTGRPQDFTINIIGGASSFTSLVQPVVECLLENGSQYIQAAESSATVLLGVIPPILASLSASADELAALNVACRRPLLGFLITLGSPSIHLDRIFDVGDLSKLLENHPSSLTLPDIERSWQRWVVVVSQYSLAAAAAANVLLLNYQLGLGTICAWWSNSTIGPLLWGWLSIPAYIVATISLRLRMRRIYSDEDLDTRIRFLDWCRLLPTRLYNFTKSELVPTVAQKDIRVRIFEETKISVAISWFLSTLIVIWVIFGSFLLYALLFIGPFNALVVIARYLASALLCRMIVIFEISGLRKTAGKTASQRRRMGL
ncbi:hypothetical protein F5Y16DRAFT_369988, partial [Xylariaceae sp. FL0255]